MPKPTPITAAERSLYFWQYKRAGSFETALWQAFACADLTNQYLLGKGFPDHAAAWRNYTSVPGYWDDLTNRIEKGE